MYNALAQQTRGGTIASTPGVSRLARLATASRSSPACLSSSLLTVEHMNSTSRTPNGGRGAQHGTAARWSRLLHIVIAVGASSVSSAYSLRWRAVRRLHRSSMISASAGWCGGLCLQQLSMLAAAGVSKHISYRIYHISRHMDERATAAPHI